MTRWGLIHTHPYIKTTFSQQHEDMRVCPRFMVSKWRQCSAAVKIPLTQKNPKRRQSSSFLPPLCVCAPAILQVSTVYVTLVWATSVRQRFHLQNSIFHSVWILFCEGDIALWWSHRTQGRYGIWIILTALWSLCLAAGWVKPSVPSQTWINQWAEDEKWKRGGKVQQTDISYIMFTSLSSDVWPDYIVAESQLQLFLPGQFNYFMIRKVVS